MKKLLVVALVMLMASMANALLLELSKDGVVTPGQAEVTLNPSDSFVIDIYDSQGYNYANGQGADNRYFVVVAQNVVPGVPVNVALGIVDALPGVVVAGHGTDTTFIDSSSANLAALGFADATGTFGFIGSYSALTWTAGRVMDLISFHCEGQGDVLIRLLVSEDSATYTPADSILVHQIPEPMTMALLGLGALLIRRK